MRNLFKLVSLGLFSVLLIGIVSNSTAQKRRYTKHSLRDSLRLEQLHRDSMMRSFKNSDGSVNSLLGKIEDYSTSYNEISNDLSRGFDTLDISQRLPQLERRMALMGTTINTSTTLGYLLTIRDLIDHVTEQMDSWGKELANDNDELDGMRNKIAVYKADTALHTIPADSSLRAQCLVQIQSLEKKMKKLDSCSKKTTIKIGILENRVSALSILLIDLNDLIDTKINSFTIKALSNEYGFIWDMHHQNKTDRLDTALSRTYALNYRLYKYFFTSKSNYYAHAGSIILLLAFLIWIISSKRKIARVKKNPESVFGETRFIVKHPYASTIVVVTILGSFFYDHPAQVFTETLLLTMMAAIGVLIKNNWPKPLYDFWKVIFAATVLFSISNLLILITYTDRIVLLLLSAVCIYASVILVKKVKVLPDTYPLYLEIILKFFIAFNALSIILNIAGRFSLAKIDGTAMIFNLCLGLGLYLFVQILMESLFLQLEANKATDSQNVTSYLDFKELQKKFKDVVIKVSVVLWLITLAENLNIDDYVYDQAKAFLNDEHKFSTTAFTFGSVLIFLIVIWISGLVARVISYFYDFAGQQQTKLSPKAKKTRSSILLIRLTIFVIGFFVAVVAAHIPMNEVTLVIGALGVGIGFGLQNIVNNLVSGIILAFEKPVQVGDIIEVSGKTGTITEIGIRSSKIDCGNGSELIVPNGDLISQHVVNWTLTNNNRQVELTIGVAYGSDVAKIDNILKDIINNHKEIMKTPAPAVLLNDFGESSINFKIFFWTEDIGKWAGLKSRVMSQVYSRFAEEGIEIAQPKHDIQIHFPGNPDLENPDNLVPPTKNPPEKDQ